MKSINILIIGKFLILLVLLATFSFSVNLQKRPELEAFNAKKLDSKASNKDSKIEFKVKTEMARLDEKLQNLYLRTRNVTTNNDTGSSNDTNPSNDSSNDQDFYYLPKIGGIAINNPLPDNTYGCPKCKPGENKAPADPQTEGTTFPQKPGVKFEQVNYVKQLSPGGKAALELDEIGE